MADQDEFWHRVTDIESAEKLEALSADQLRDHERYFVEVQYLPQLPPWEKSAAGNHLIRLQNEINRRTSARQHTHAIGLAEQTLTWAKVAGGAAIAAVIVAAIPLLIQYCSQTPPAAPTTPSPRATGTISESPETAATSTPLMSLAHPTATIQTLPAVGATAAIHDSPSRIMSPPQSTATTRPPTPP
jgi:hypothetical protein